MPQISKIRIVNVYYNGGSRLIPDELYDLCGDGKPLDTLFNLVNGGGKSVIVQFLMQPVKPNAKESDRKISEFFLKNTDHSFVLLEWQKDNSRGKLLTGIAVKARDSEYSEEETRNRSVRYYTFMTEYDGSSKYSIENLELSERKDGRFVPAGFDVIKKIKNKSGGLLQTYSSDENKKWKEKLAEFGIYQEEWENVIQRLNAEEGGLIKFFEKITTSGKLLSTFFIPAIDSKLRSGAESVKGDDAGLETMFLNYARKVAGKSKLIREQKINEGFLTDMSGITTGCREITSVDEEYIRSQAKGFGFRSAAVKKKNDNNTLIGSFASKIEETEKEKRHIEYERATWNFYIAKRAYSDTEGELNKVKKDAEDKKTELQTAEKEYRLMKCAGIALKIRQSRAEKKGIDAQINARELKSDNAKRIKSLKFSLSVKAGTECEKLEILGSSLKEELVHEKENIDRKTDELKDRKKAASNAGIELKAAEKNLEDYKRETDAECGSLGFEAVRRLDGFYSDEDISGFADNKTTLRDSYDKKTAELDAALKKLDERIINIAEEIPVLKENLKRNEDEIQRLEDEIEVYCRREDEVKVIAQRCTMDFSEIFSGGLFSYLEGEKEKTVSQRAAEMHSLGVFEKKQAAVKGGHLHIIDDVFELAASAGVAFQTAENYLTGLSEKEDIPPERLSGILEEYPFIAYSLIFDDKKQIIKFLDSVNTDEWLPAAVPLITYEQLEQALDGSLSAEEFLACYDDSFFKDKKSYESSLSRQIKDTEEIIDVLSSHKEELEKDIETVGAFDYSNDFAEKEKAAKKECEKKTAEIRKKINELSEGRASAEKEKDERKKEKEDVLKKMTVLDNIILHVEEIRKRSVSERKKYDEIQERYSAAKKAEEGVRECENELMELSYRNKQTEEKTERLQKRKDYLYQVMEKTGKTPPAADIIDEDIESMEAEYDKLLQTMNEELEELKSIRDRLINSIKESEKRLRDIKISENEYKDISYTETESDRLEEKKNILSSEYNDLLDKAAKAEGNFGKADSVYKAAVTELKKYSDEPLPKEQTGSDFEKRLGEAEKKIAVYTNEKRRLEGSNSSLSEIIATAGERLSGFKIPETVPAVEIDFSEDKIKAQWKEIRLLITSYGDRLDKAVQDVKGLIDKVREKYGSSLQKDISDGLVSIKRTLEKGDHKAAAAACEAMEHNISLLNAKLEYELSGIKSDFDHLAKQCRLQGRAVYKNLKMIAKNSSIKVYDSDKPRQMIKFGMPEDDEGLDIQADAAIKSEIEKGVEEIEDIISGGTVRPVDEKKAAIKYVGSEKLFYLYVGKEDIPVNVYKIDINKENSRYKSWEQALKENSGGEKFVVFFTAVLSLMNYTRSESGIVNKYSTGVLLLDNPFGVITSRHLLEPVFRISDHFHVQLICFSDITKADVVSCFDNVIRLVIKNRTGSRLSVLTHDGNEEIEHGYYKTYGQMTLEDMNFTGE